MIWAIKCDLFHLLSYKLGKTFSFGCNYPIHFFISGSNPIFR